MQYEKRVFKKDLEQCAHCGGRRVLIALITDGPAVYKILSHIGLPTEAPAIVSARAPPQIDLVFEGLAELNHHQQGPSNKPHTIRCDLRKF